jgi:urease accessory protein
MSFPPLPEPMTPALASGSAAVKSPESTEPAMPHSLGPQGLQKDPRADQGTGCWEGKLALTYSHSERGTHISHSYTQAPLRLQRAFYPEGPERCQTVIVHTAGGMVGGDRLTLDLCLEPNAKALLTTAAAAKIYRSNGPEAQQVIQVQVGAGACLEWLPQETIVFNQASYRQSMDVTLEPGGQWLGWEVTRLGRTAMGEQFVAGDWRSRTAVYAQRADGSRLPLWLDRQWLAGSPETWASPHGLNQCPVVGSLAWLGAKGDDGILEQVRSAWQSLNPELLEQAGVTRLATTGAFPGLLCRYRGHSTTRANRWFRLVWQLIRRSQLQDQGVGPPVALPRVWR